MTNPLDYPQINWSTVTAISSSPSVALEQYMLWLAQDAAMWATKAERGELPMPEALHEISASAGMAEALGEREQFNQLLEGRINEIRTEMAEFRNFIPVARKNGQHRPHGQVIEEMLANGG